MMIYDKGVILLMHPEAELTADEKQTLLDGLNATLAADPPSHKRAELDHKSRWSLGLQPHLPI